MSFVTIYHPTKGHRQISAIDFTPAWIAQGWSRSPITEPQPTEPIPQIELLAEDGSKEIIPALELINRAHEVSDLTPLPSVGTGAAQLILDGRPDGGYDSLEALPEKLFKQPYRCDIEKIKGWMDA